MSLNLFHRLLSEEWKVTQFCTQLIAMAAHYKLDGWLINIENPIYVSFISHNYCIKCFLIASDCIHTDTMYI